MVSAETKCALRCPRRGRAALAKFLLDRFHRVPEIPVGSGPTRRMDAGRAVEGIDHEAGIVGKGRQAGRRCRRLRFDARVFAERRAGFFWFAQSHLTCRYGLDPVGRQQLAHFLELPGIMGGYDQTTGGGRRRTDFSVPYQCPNSCSSVCCRPSSVLRFHITAIFCRSMSLAMPLRASANRVVSCSSENGTFSAVACTSTMLPEPVRTKFASVSACESSA